MVHKDLVWVALVADPELDSIEPTSPSPLGILLGMEDMAEA